MPRRLSSCPGGRLGRRAFLGHGLAVAAASTMPCRAFSQNKQVNIYNWDTYTGETTLEFEGLESVERTPVRPRQAGQAGRSGQAGHAVQGGAR